MTNWSEKKLSRNIARGDEKSFARVYDLYVNKLYKFVFLKTNSREATEEIVQDVFMKFWKFALNNGKDIKSISAVLYKIARHLVIDYYRSSSVDKAFFQLEENILPDGIYGKDIAKDIDTEYDLKEVEQAISILPEQYQNIIIMKYIDDLTNKEIAEALDKEEGNIRVLAHRALIALKKIVLKN